MLILSPRISLLAQQVRPLYHLSVVPSSSSNACSWDPCPRGSVRTYAKATVGIPSLGKKGGKKGAGPAIEKKKLPVETDPNKLVNYLCGSCVTKEGEEIKLKEDSEYPEWLWKLDTSGKAPPLEELDPDTDRYWARVRKIAMKRSLSLMKLKKF